VQCTIALNGLSGSLGVPVERATSQRRNSLGRDVPASANGPEHHIDHFVLRSARCQGRVTPSRAAMQTAMCGITRPKCPTPMPHSHVARGRPTVIPPGRATRMPRAEMRAGSRLIKGRESHARSASLGQGRVDVAPAITHASAHFLAALVLIALSDLLRLERLRREEHTRITAAAWPSRRVFQPPIPCPLSRLFHGSTC
jgi:hypothetical protein